MANVTSRTLTMRIMRVKMSRVRGGRAAILNSSDGTAQPLSAQQWGGAFCALTCCCPPSQASHLLSKLREPMLQLLVLLPLERFVPVNASDSSQGAQPPA